MALGALVAALCAAPVAAAPADPSTMCSAVREAGGGWSAWHCGPREWNRVPAEARVRMTVAEGTEARFVLTRLSQMRGGQLRVEGRDGAVVERALALDDFTVAHGQWLMQLPLPQLAGGIAAVELTYREPRHTGPVSYTHLTLPTNREV